MLLDELAYDIHLSNKDLGRDRSGIDVDEIRNRRTDLEHGPGFKRYALSNEASLTEARDADWFAARVGDGMTAATGSRHESTFFHPTKPPPPGVDGKPLAVPT